MDGHEFHLLLCKYFSTVTVLLYLPHLFVCIYFVINGKGLFEGTEMGNKAIFTYFLYTCNGICSIKVPYSIAFRPIQNQWSKLKFLPYLWGLLNYFSLPQENPMGEVK